MFKPFIVFEDRICDGIEWDCSDRSDEGEKCITDPVLADRFGCCRNLEVSMSLGFIAPGLTEELKFDPAKWDDVMNRPTFEGSIVGTILWQLLNQVYTRIYKKS